MKPIYEITANGKPITSLVGPILVSLTVTDETGNRADGFSLKLEDTGALELPEKGALIGIKLGYLSTGLVDYGTYTVDTVQGSGPPSILQIDGHAVPFSGGDGNARMQARKSRSWHALTLADVVKTIAGEHGLTPAVDSELGAIDLGHEDQTGESDVSFLHRLARDAGAAVKITAGRLAMIARGMGRTATGQAMPTVALVRSDLSTWGWTFADRGDYKSVAATYRDVGKAETAEVILGDGEPVLRLPHTYATKSTATRAAKARLADHQRSSGGTLQLTMGGRLDLIAETPISVTGLRQGVDGDWIIRRVSHTLDKSGGLKTSVDGEKHLTKEAEG